MNYDKPRHNSNQSYPYDFNSLRYADDAELRRVYDKFKEFQRADANESLRKMDEESLNNFLKNYRLYGFRKKDLPEISKWTRAALNAGYSYFEITKVKLYDILNIPMSYSVFLGLGFFCLCRFYIKDYLYASIRLIANILFAIASIFAFGTKWITPVIIIPIVWAIIDVFTLGSRMRKKNGENIIAHCKKLVEAKRG